MEPHERGEQIRKRYRKSEKAIKMKDCWHLPTLRKEVKLLVIECQHLLQNKNMNKLTIARRKLESIVDFCQQNSFKDGGHLRNRNFAILADRQNVPKMDTITNITKTTCLQLPKSHDLPQYTMAPLPLWALGVKFPNVSPLAFMWGSGTITYKAFCRFIRAMPFHQSSSLLCLQSVRSHCRAL